ncbi:hypothetical protein EJ06DRAFT_127784 [Trichodelitschia bisporula]|uniref:RING-type domain-containing protein n=1 Tax=Trichodelitschia bisporula TaxID=703511 RepID=A0A6G1HQU7_9PEZI|nr:hypothetical protein EJ06DRAFT_127784 [Trichodelitschia bisporula]
MTTPPWCPHDRPRDRPPNNPPSSPPRRTPGVVLVLASPAQPGVTRTLGQEVVDWERRGGRGMLRVPEERTPGSYDTSTRRAYEYSPPGSYDVSMRRTYDTSGALSSSAPAASAHGTPRVTPTLRTYSSLNTPATRSVAHRTPSLSPTGLSCTLTHAARQPTSQASCPICAAPLAGAGLGQLVWCKGECGANVHRACFDAWRATAPVPVRCVMCRAVWRRACVHDTQDAGERRDEWRRGEGEWAREGYGGG